MNLADVVAPAVPPELAVLDADGVIIAVNESWLHFARDNDAPAGWTGVGVSYLAVCDKAGDPTSLAVARAIRAALHGELAGWAAIEIACHSPQERRWFDVVISPRLAASGRPLGAVVSVVRISGRDPVRAGNGPGRRASGRSFAAAGSAAAGSAAADEAPPARLALDHYPDALVAVSDDGRIVAVNDALCRLFGRRREDVLGRPVEHLVPPRSRGMHRRLRAGFAHSPRRRAMGPEAQVLAGQHADGRTIPVRVTLSPAELDGRPVLLAAVRDASALVAAESQARLVADLLDATADAIAVHRADDLRPVWVNRTLAELSGYSRDDLLDDGQAAGVLDLPRLRIAARPLLDGRQPAARWRDVLTRRDGSRLPVEIRAVYRERSPGEGYLVVVRRDLTETERAQSERERLARLEERARIARDLHDSTIQGLYANGMRLSAAMDQVTDPLARRRIQEATTAMDTAIGQLRETISRLSEPGDRVPVRDLLEAVLVMRTPPLQHEPTLSITGDPDVLPDDVVEELIQVITASVSNVARHAQAARTDVWLDVAPDGAWELTIVDDGRGFDPATTPPGTGLSNLAARAALLRADLSIRSAPGHGTRIRLRSARAPSRAGT